MEGSTSAPAAAAVAASASAGGSAHWYKDAIIYQLHIKAFFDANDDGIGDFRGPRREARLRQGPRASTRSGCCRSTRRRCAMTDTTSPTTATCIRRTERAPTSSSSSARRTAASCASSPSSSINHTSDQHPWFQAARHAPKGSSKRNYYVWSDDPNKYAGTRIIFTDTEKSNWTWDDVAKAYYWHRFFSHQPDLNFDNPQVLKALFRVMRFWLDMGVDGFRLDAIPYLCEREGTNNENLPETHAVLQPAARAGRRALPERAAAGRGEPMARGRARILRRRRRVPHGVSLPADAAHVHGHRAGGPPSGHRDHAADAGHPRQLPVGDLPAQPRRAHARDGDAQGARLHVPDVRRRPARAHQRRHQAAPRAAAGERSRSASSC